MTTGRVLSWAVLIAALLAIVYRYHTQLATWIETVEVRIADLGAWGPLAYLVLFVLLTSCFVPDSLLSAAAGALFGTVVGMAVSFAGALVAQSIAFFLSRGFLQKRVNAAIANRPKFASIPRIVDQEGLRLQVLLRLTPLNPVLLSYIFGTTGTRFGTFMLACLGIAPGMFAQVYCGYAAKHMIKTAGMPHEHSWLKTGLVVSGLIACLLVLVIIVRIAQKAIAEAQLRAG